MQSDAAMVWSSPDGRVVVWRREARGGRMGLTNKYTLAIGRLPDLFAKIRDGQAPEQFTQQLLKDWGFTSSNDRVMLPLLKDLGFLSSEGKPTNRYHDYRDHSRSKA